MAPSFHALRRSLRAAKAERLRSLEMALPAAAPTLLADLVPSPQSAAERAKLQDPAFEHNGTRLEPLGRALVAHLSDTLGLSELFCWELLQRTTASTPGATAAQLQSLASTAYYAERRTRLLLLLDALKLAAAGAERAGATHAVACDFLRALDAAARSSDIQASSSSGGRRDGDCSLLEVLVRLVDARENRGRGRAGAGVAAESAATTTGSLWTSSLAGTTGSSSTGSDADELRLVCVCIFYRCCLDEVPPPSSAIAKLISSLRQSTSSLGSISRNHVLLLAVLAALAPSSNTAARHRATREHVAVAARPLVDEWVRDATHASETIVTGAAGTSAGWRGAGAGNARSKAATRFTDGCAFAVQLACSLAQPCADLPRGYLHDLDGKVTS